VAIAGASRGGHDGGDLRKRLPVVGQLARRHERTQEGTGVVGRHRVRFTRFLDHGISRKCTAAT
jgi:hypothetical protein